MATTVESSRQDETSATPAGRPDGDSSTLPGQGSARVDFGAHLEDTEAGLVQDNDIAPLGKSKTYSRKASQDSARRALQRLSTAPVGSSGRPQLLERSSTLLRRTMKFPSERKELVFEPQPSDSELDSSDDETSTARSESVDEAGKKTKKKTKQDKQGRERSRSYSRFTWGNEYFKTKGRVSKRDGRLNISIKDTAHTGYLAKALGYTIKPHLMLPNKQSQKEQKKQGAQHPDATANAGPRTVSLPQGPLPKLNIVIIVIGSRGDIQPFLKVGKILHDNYGHRVRIATHPAFRDFIEKETDLEFFSVGGDPAELMSFMVKNPGLVPNLQTIRQGEIQRRRAAMAEMFDGMWRACTNTVDDEKDFLNLKMAGEKFPFVADAIIANPPSMAHFHIAERLGIPLHGMFTFPYTPTQAFPNPLANIRAGKSNVDESYVNFMSYPLVHLMIWQGLGDIINNFRVNTLHLEPVSPLWAPSALYRMKVPFTYMWSPSLVPKPQDWGSEVSIGGFVFLELANNFKPSKELTDFLDAGEPPVYIGFGSIVVDDPNELTTMILKAVKMAGVRALINKGWGGFGTTNENTPDNVFMLGNTPHDWLFPKVKAVVHHGGAGTTAIGLKCGKPTMIVPFFGDQPFWGARVAEAKAGAHFCVPWKRLTAEKLAEGIKQCLTEEAQQNVQKLADLIAMEGDGAENAVNAFHQNLPLHGNNNMRCSFLEDRVARWTLKSSSLKLSTLAAEILMEQKKIKPCDLKLFHVYSWDDFDGPGEPLTGTVGAFTDSLYSIGAGVGMAPIRAGKSMRRRAEHEKRKQEAKKRREERKKQKEQSQQEADALQIAENGSTAQRPGNPRKDTTETLGSKLSADPQTSLAMEVVKEIGYGLKQSGTALLTMPDDFLVALAQGLHNAPRLWGDTTVRKPMRVTGVKSGLKAAYREFGYGVFDGWTGLITQPVHGYRDGTTARMKLTGLGTGIGKGIGGFAVKNISAVVSPPAYAGKGLTVYLKKKGEANALGSKTYIRRAHLVQGQRDLRALREPGDASKQELQRIEALVRNGWRVHEDSLRSLHHAHDAMSRNWAGRLKERVEKQCHALGHHEDAYVSEKGFGETKTNDKTAGRLTRNSTEVGKARYSHDAATPARTSDGDEIKLPKRRRDIETPSEQAPEIELVTPASEDEVPKLSDGEYTDSTSMTRSDSDFKDRSDAVWPGQRLGPGHAAVNFSGMQEVTKQHFWPLGRVTTA